MNEHRYQYHVLKFPDFHNCQGHNTMYLSHVIPGLDHLEALFALIWNLVHARDFTGTEDEKAWVKDAVRGGIYPLVRIEDLVDHNWTTAPNAQEAFNELVEKKVIQETGKIVNTKRVLDGNVLRTTSDKVLAPLARKAGFYFSQSPQNSLSGGCLVYERFASQNIQRNGK